MNADEWTTAADLYLLEGRRAVVEGALRRMRMILREPHRPTSVRRSTTQFAPAHDTWSVIHDADMDGVSIAMTQPSGGRWRALFLRGNGDPTGAIAPTGDDAGMVRCTQALAFHLEAALARGLPIAEADPRIAASLIGRAMRVHRSDGGRDSLHSTTATPWSPVRVFEEFVTDTGAIRAGPNLVPPRDRRRPTPTILVVEVEDDGFNSNVMIHPLETYVAPERVAMLDEMRAYAALADLEGDALRAARTRLLAGPRTI